MLIDFHTHILPEIDDGSRNVEMSLNMLAAQREQQVDEIVATPHFYAQKDSVEEFLLRRQRSYEKLKTKMAETKVWIRSCIWQRKSTTFRESEVPE
ncbi:MAG: CpsB/CapC family capsule biosynthesis tyrosine phosphatase [Roseburia faecis]